MYELTTQSGRTAQVRSDMLARSERIAGLDPEGRIVIDDYDARNPEKKPSVIGGHTLGIFMFGLTLCCQASDKGTESGVCCRACYGTAPGADEGSYLYRNEADGTFPDLDPIKDLRKV